VVDAQSPAGVPGGNVETSQRITDVVLGALAQALPDRIPEASSGTMNNLTLGGIDPRTGQPFAYYETIAGGMGARPSAPGLSAVHTHMTNSLNTPIEALEHFYPFRVRRYGVRRGSGGAGKFRGGEGIIKQIELLADAEVTILSDRRRRGPYGLSGGKAGKPGVNRINGKRVASKARLQCRAGDVLTIETPGGGGFGSS
jgi:N-methylhydantoinase B